MTAITVPAQIMRDDGTTMLDGQITFPDGAPGGSSLGLWQLTQDIVFAADPSGDLGSLNLSAAFDPANTDAGSLNGVASFPAYTYGATGTILTVSPGGLSLNVPSTADALELAVTIAVFNAAGTDYLQLVGDASIAIGDTIATLTLAAFTATAVAGVDLTWTVGTGVVATTAGGIYACVAVVRVYWD